MKCQIIDTAREKNYYYRMKYQTPNPTPGCAFPKPVRQKSRPTTPDKPKRLRETAKARATTPPHNSIVEQCCKLLDTQYPHLAYWHMPDELYRLIMPPLSGDPLAWIFQNALGYEGGNELKRGLAASLKGVPDLIVIDFSCCPPRCLVGDVKRPGDQLRKSQRRWARGNSVQTWGSVDEFQVALASFLGTPSNSVSRSNTDPERS